MTELEAIRAAARELIASHARRPVWNVRENDRQAVTTRLLRDRLDGPQGIPVTRLVGGSPRKFKQLSTPTGLRTSRVHTELKLSSNLTKSGHSSDRYDVVVLRERGVALKRDNYGPCNLELVVHAADVAAVVELKSESFEFRPSGRAGLHGGQVDFEKLLELACWCGRHEIAPPLLVQIIVDTGVPVGQLGWQITPWQDQRKPGWRWPVEAEDVGRHCPSDTTVYCFTLGEDIGPVEWRWTVASGWRAQRG